MSDEDDMKPLTGSDDKFVLPEVTNYVFDKSNRQTNEQKELDVATLNHRLSNLLGPADSIQLCSNLIRLISGKRVLDVGVFTGASSLAWASAIPDDGEVIAIDLTDKYYLEVGQAYFKKACVDHKLKFMLGDAQKSLNQLLADGEGNSFDFAFLDADKKNQIDYYEACIKLLRPGGIIGVDNTIWSGRVVDVNNTQADTIYIRKFNDHLKNDTRIDLSMLTIGDGLTLCFKK